VAEGALVQVDYDGSDPTGTKVLVLIRLCLSTAAASSPTDTAIRRCPILRFVPSHRLLLALAVGSGITLDKFTVTAKRSGFLSTSIRLQLTFATSSVSDW